MASRTRKRSIVVKGWDGGEIMLEDIWREAVRLCYPREVVETTTTTSLGLDGKVQWSKTVEKRYVVEPNMKAMRMVLANFDPAFHDNDEGAVGRAEEELKLRKSETLARRWSVEAGCETTQPHAVGCADGDPRGSDRVISEGSEE